jgi:hypothetical protein
MGESYTQEFHNIITRTGLFLNKNTVKIFIQVNFFEGFSHFIVERDKEKYQGFLAKHQVTRYNLKNHVNIKSMKRKRWINDREALPYLR